MRIKVSSESPRKDRWTELELETTLVGYRLAVSGCSRLPGETKRTRVTRCPSAGDVLTELRMASNGYSRLAERLLDEAAEQDEDIARAWSRS